MTHEHDLLFSLLVVFELKDVYLKGLLVLTHFAEHYCARLKVCRVCYC